MNLTRTCIRPLFAVCLFSAVLAGCAGIPDPADRPSPVDLPAQWNNALQAPTGLSPGWLSDFDDPTLTEFVGEALRQNFELKSTAAAVEAALANAGISGADRLPQIDAIFDASRTKRNTAGGFQITNATTDRFGLQGSVSWQLDLWGRLHNQVQAAVLDLEAAQADLEAARLSLAANIAKFWFSAIEAKLQVELAERTVDNFRANRETIEEGYRLGINSALDVRLSRANVASAEGQLRAQQAIEDASTRSLEVLLGRYPTAELSLASALPQVKRDVPAGLPSELLARRPDLIAAERRLAAGEQRVKFAKKGLLPNISLTNSGGTSSAEFSRLLDPESLIWSVAANVVQPLFQGGRLKNEIVLSLANENQAFADYGQVVLTAFQEVETTLAAEGFLTGQELALQTAAEESSEAEKLAQEEYLAGLTDIITLLESQRRAFDSKSALISIKNQRLQNRIDLYLALGGPFELGAEATPDQVSDNESELNKAGIR